MNSVTRSQARKRKILENSEERLQKILEARDGKAKTADPKNTKHNHVVERNSSIKSIVNEITPNTKKRRGSHSSSHNVSNAGSHSDIYFHNSLFKLVYFVLGGVVRVLLHLEKGAIFKESAVAPFVGVFLMQLMCENMAMKKYEVNISYLVSLGFGSNLSYGIAIIYHMMADVFRYFSLYMFTFVTVHLIIDIFSLI